MSYFNYEQKDESFPERQDPSFPPSGAENRPQQPYGAEYRQQPYGAQPGGAYAAAGRPAGYGSAYTSPISYDTGRSASGGRVYEPAAAGAFDGHAAAGVPSGPAPAGAFGSVFPAGRPGDPAAAGIPSVPVYPGGDQVPSGAGVSEPAASCEEVEPAESAGPAPGAGGAASGVYGAQPGASAPVNQPGAYAPVDPVGAYAPAKGPARRIRTKKKSGGLGKGAVALALCCALIGGAAGAGGALLIKGGSDKAKTEEASNTRPSTSVMVADGSGRVQYTAAEAGTLLTAEEVYAQNVNSTVGITTEITTTNFFGFTSTSAASGSGFILTEDGYILTNHHVIEGANSITVTTYDGKTYRARLVGSSEENDIAVLKIDGKDLKPVKIGSSSDLQVGQDVIAIGNPLGELTFSLTKGVVSALDREVTMSNRHKMNLIQTDCAINSGNSGGALFNLYGEVVGITNAKYSTSVFSGQASIDNIGFAIPIDSVLDLVAYIIERG